MALTLTNDITATQTTFDVAGSDALNPGDLKTIGSETLEIRTANRGTPNYGESGYWRVNANRGSLGTAKATHAAGATLTTATFGGGGSTDASDIVLDPEVAGEADVQAALEAVAAGAVQTVSLIGPYHVDFDDVGLDAGVLLTALDVGTWLWGVSVIAVVGPDGGEGAIDFNVGLGGPGGADILDGWHASTTGAIQPTGNTFTAGTPTDEVFTFAPVTLIDEGGGLYAIYTTDVPPIQGSWDIYALIATSS